MSTCFLFGSLHSPTIGIDRCFPLLPVSVPVFPTAPSMVPCSDFQTTRTRSIRFFPAKVPTNIFLASPPPVLRIKASPHDIAANEAACRWHSTRPPTTPRSFLFPWSCDTTIFCPAPSQLRRKDFIPSPVSRPRASVIPQRMLFFPSKENGSYPSR